MTHALSVADLLAVEIPTEWTARKTAPRVLGAAPLDSMDPRVARAHALALRLPPSVEGHGGDAALFSAANELGSILGTDADAIAVALDTFNARCAPPWDAAKLHREATRAAEREAAPERQYARRASARAEARECAPVATPTASTGRDASALDLLENWAVEPAPLKYTLEQLAIAPSDRQITLIGGDPGAGKGPLADYLALCLAMGRRVFGAWDTIPHRTAILDLEGRRLTSMRIRSQCRGMRIDPQELNGRLFLRDTDPLDMSDLGWLETWIADEGISVLVLDSYTSAMAEFDVDENKMQFASLARMLGALNVTVIAVAHARKPSAGARNTRPSLADVLGSGALGAYAQTGISIWRPDDDAPLVQRLGCMRAPVVAFPQYEITWHVDGPTDAQAWTATAQQVSEDRAHAEGVAQLLGARRICSRMLSDRTAPWSVVALTSTTGLSQARVSACIAPLIDVGIVRYEHGIGRGAGAYAWAHNGAFDLDRLVVGRGGEVEVAKG